VSCDGAAPRNDGCSVDAVAIPPSRTMRGKGGATTWKATRKNRPAPDHFTVIVSLAFSADPLLSYPTTSRRCDPAESETDVLRVLLVDVYTDFAST